MRAEKWLTPLFEAILSLSELVLAALLFPMRQSLAIPLETPEQPSYVVRRPTALVPGTTEPAPTQKAPVWTRSWGDIPQPWDEYASRAV